MSIITGISPNLNSFNTSYKLSNKQNIKLPPMLNFYSPIANTKKVFFNLFQGD